VESAVGAFLLNQADEEGFRVCYWRERDDEVDFVIEYNKQCIAIEVKSGKRTENNGLTKFKNKFNPKHLLVVGSGGIPLDEFLTADISKLF
jgi:predicted AAA+ superfamily ATPase